VVILVSLDYGAGVAAVWRDARGVWLGAGPAGAGDDTGSIGGTLLDTRPARMGVGAGRMVVGGLLAPGASRAVVEGLPAATGNGAWIAIIASYTVAPEPAARFEADDGTIVRPELPADWTREPVSDADQPCPACGDVSWVRVTPTDGSRGTHGSSGSRMRPTAVIVRTRCGHEVSEDSWYGPGVSTRVPGLRFRAVGGLWNGGRIRRRAREPAIDALDFPVYAVDDVDAELASHGWDRCGVHSVTMRHDEVEITTRALRHALAEKGDETAHALTSVIGRVEPVSWGRGSNAARALRIDTHRRAVAMRVAHAERWQLELPVGDTPVRFTGLRDPAAGPPSAPPPECGS
jgi:hypothetical protein